MTMPLTGDIALAWSVILSAYAMVASWVSGRLLHARFRESARGAAVAAALSLTTAVFVVEYLLMVGDYRVRAVYDHSSRTLPLIYKLGALWGGNSGSVLFWGWILSLYLAWTAWRRWNISARVTSTVMSLMSGMLLFFTLLSFWVVNPFASVVGEPTNGVGLDPLLRNPVMVIHPPAMYVGLIGMALPAAYMVSALWHRTPWRDWIPLVRRLMVFAWLVLGSALILGGMWAYMELGWGGYWEWDPVENAALMPWLMATAFLHALQLEERRQTYRWWTAGLGAAAFLLTLVGTYITRSGILKNSVHSFTGTGVGPYFALLLGLCFAIVVAVFVMRRDQLADPLPAGDAAGKETLYILLYMTLTVVAVVVLAGTFYPILSRAAFGQTVVLEQSFFNDSTAPLFLLALLAMGTAPVVSWGKPPASRIGRGVAVPGALGAGGALTAVLSGYHQVLPVAAVGIIVFSGASMVREFLRGGRAMRRAHGGMLVSALVHAVGRHRRRYGGYLAHLALLVVALGVVGSHTGAISVTKILGPGQSVTVPGYRITYQRLQTLSKPGRIIAQAQVAVVSGHRRWTAHPGMSFYSGAAQPVADVSIHQGIMKNLYMVLEGTTNHGGALLQVMVNPLVTWIWLGLPLLLLGGIVALSAGGARGSSLGPPSEWNEIRVPEASDIETGRNPL